MIFSTTITNWIISGFIAVTGNNGLTMGHQQWYVKSFPSKIECESAMPYWKDKIEQHYKEDNLTVLWNYSTYECVIEEDGE